MKTHDETLVRIVDHSFDPPRCLFGTQEDVLTGYAVDSLKSIGLAKANWYMRGDIPPRYPMPAIRHDVILWDRDGNGSMLEAFDATCLASKPRCLTILAERVGHWEHVYPMD